MLFNFGKSKKVEPQTKHYNQQQMAFYNWCRKFEQTAQRFVNSDGNAPFTIAAGLAKKPSGGIEDIHDMSVLRLYPKKVTSKFIYEYQGEYKEYEKQSIFIADMRSLYAEYGNSPLHIEDIFERWINEPNCPYWDAATRFKQKFTPEEYAAEHRAPNPNLPQMEI